MAVPSIATSIAGSVASSRAVTVGLKTAHKKRRGPGLYHNELSEQEKRLLKAAFDYFLQRKELAACRTISPFMG